MGSARAAKSEPEEELLTRHEIVAALDDGTHAQTITKWVADGCPVAQRGRSGKPHLYRLSDIRSWLARREVENAAPSPTGTGPLNVNQQRALKEHWQAKLNEQKHREREGELIPREDVEREWGAEVAAVRARLLALPTTLADQLHRAAVIDGVPGVEVELTKAVRAVLTELADPKRKDPGEEKPAKRKRSPAVKKRATKKKPTRKKAAAKKRTTKKKPTRKKAAAKRTTKKTATRKKAATKKRR